MIIELSVAVIAIAFVVLVAFLITTLRSMTALIAQSNVAVHELQIQLAGISREASDLLQHTNAVTADVLNKLHSLEPTFDSVKQVGEAAEQITSSVKQASTAVARTIREQAATEPNLPPTGTVASTVAHVVKLAPLALDIWQQLKQLKHRQAQTAKS